MGSMIHDHKRVALHKDTFNTPNFVLIVHDFYIDGDKAQLVGSSSLSSWMK